MKINFEKKLVLSAIFIALIPLIFSYGIFISDKLDTYDETIKDMLRYTAYDISTNSLVKEKLINKENDGTLQSYTKDIISYNEWIDIIVICDMNGEKYSHLDESQIGEIFVNPDKISVLENGKGYYSLMEGSMGVTFRWFEPIKDGENQIGFVMVGKYYSDINKVNLKVKLNYILLFIVTIIVSIILFKFLARKTKKEMFDMEPEEIARLYNEKQIIIDSVENGIIVLNKYNKVIEVNENYYKLFNNFDVDKVIKRLESYIDEKQSFKMKEFVIQNKKVFITLSTIINSEEYLGVLILLSDKNNIDKLAKEITGIDEAAKSLRANIHEFKNHLHVILGLIQLELYYEAKKYILNIQKVQEDNDIEFLQIKDFWVRALLLSRKAVANEKSVKLNLYNESILWENHGIIESNDIVTILGNLIENSFEACSVSNNSDKLVEVYLNEDDYKIEIKVKDNGVPLLYDNIDEMTIEGVSSKGEGRGIGLYLVKSKVELYNGNIEIKEYNDEKIFCITIFKGE